MTNTTNATPVKMNISDFGSHELAIIVGIDATVKNHLMHDDINSAIMCLRNNFVFTSDQFDEAYVAMVMAIQSDKIPTLCYKL